MVHQNSEEEVARLTEIAKTAALKKNIDPDQITKEMTSTQLPALNIPTIQYDDADDIGMVNTSFVDNE